jgi:hypothetical protein
MDMLYKLNQELLNRLDDCNIEKSYTSERGATFLPFIDSELEEENIYVQMSGIFSGKRGVYYEFELSDSDVSILKKVEKKLNNMYNSKYRQFRIIDDNILVVKGRNYNFYGSDGEIIEDDLVEGSNYDFVVHFRGLVEILDLAYYYLEMLRIRISKKSDLDEEETNFEVPDVLN